MLWLALHFPAFPLDILTRGGPSSRPIAIAERQGRRTRVAVCNASAAAQGVRPGMAASAAQALVLGLILRERDRRSETEALEGLAAWAGRFTPAVSLQPPAGLLLEIGGCLRLHRGLDRLLSLLLAGVGEMGYAAVHGCAATPHAAWLLARSGTGTCVADGTRLQDSLAPLPLRLLEQPPEVHEGLETIGARTLGDCLALPRAGLVRRFGRGLADELDRALGLVPEPRAYFVPPPEFARRLELPAAVQEAQALLFAARRLLPELEGYLGLRQAGVQEIELRCRHDAMSETLLRVGFAQPTSAADRMLLLLRETLSRTRLTAPVLSIALHARRILPLAPRSDDLFRALEPEGDGSLLLERLRIRLGPESVQGVALAADHRPELAWRPCAPGESPADASSPMPPGTRRPLWLLSSPQPCTDRRLSLQAGPERIESGWWDGREAERDYYVAQDRHGARLWVYRERASGAWFVHGLFA